MKSSQKLKEKLRRILLARASLDAYSWPCTDSELDAVARSIENHLNQSGDVLNEDPLIEWLEEYKFFLSERLRQEGG